MRGGASEQYFHSRRLYATILANGEDAAMPVLSDTELRMVAEIVTEMARSSRVPFDGAAKGAALARAALIDPAFKARLSEAHRRLDVWRVTKEAHAFMEPIAPHLRDLELDAEMVLSAWKA
jgi:hypothetical protein